MVAEITGMSRVEADYWWDLFSGLDVPDRMRVELIGSEIVVNPPPKGGHEHDLWRFHLQVVRSAGDEVECGSVGLRTPGGLFIPDSVVVPKDRLREMTKDWNPVTGVLLVVEVTSSRPSTNREEKRLGYAAAGVPLYLLVDRSREQLVLFSQPKEDDYRADVRVPFGSPLELPAPFSFTLDTSDFV